MDKGVTARLRMRFECTIMRVVEPPSSNDSSDSDDRSDVLEMRSQRKGDRSANNPVNQFTDEYWKSTKASEKSKEDRVEDERLNMAHTATESFSVLNELVVVFPEKIVYLILGSWTKSIFEHIGIV